MGRRQASMNNRLQVLPKTVTEESSTIRSQKQIRVPLPCGGDRILIKRTSEANRKEKRMSEAAFRQYYAQLTDDELVRVLADRQHLVPEAVGVLDLEVQRRHVVLPVPPQWTIHPDSDELALEDYDAYRHLVERRKTYRRYYFGLFMGPYILGLVLARARVESSDLFMFVTLGWAMCVALYDLILNTRFLGFRCPQCSQSFGHGDECFNCGFPRSRK